MDLPSRDFAALVRDMSAAITASAGKLIDLSVGSILRAIIEANAAIVLWVQWLVLLTLQTTRAATSTGADLDSWMADFSLARTPALAATGVVTFSRFAGSVAALVMVGTMVKTQDGSVSFSVTADPGNSSWQASTGAYYMAIGVLAVDVPIVAMVPGTGGNVLPGTITLLASAIPGIDCINNQIPTSSGMDAESDDAFRIRFANFFAARSRATMDAVAYAISSVGPSLNFLIQENVDAAGNPMVGNILVIVNDGSGSLSNSLFASLGTALASVRPLGTSFSIQPPKIIQVDICLTLDTAPQSSITSAQDAIQSALENYVNNRPIGSTLSLTRISQLAYRTEPQLINVSNVTLNGLGEDLIAPPTSAFQVSSVSFV